jgi:predicted MPP superfamily phosphohydrolase
MVLSGHAHGGQVRIPFILNGLYAPHQGFFPKYAGGVYDHENYTHIVSRGSSFNPKLPRIFNPPEVVSITIKGE